MKNTLSAILLVVVGLMLTAGQAAAQERFGGLSGVVTDSSGGVLPGATVTITNLVSGAVRTVVSGGDGRYLLPDIEPGHYSVKMELQGFTRVEFEDVNVLLGKMLRADASLKVGDISEVVQVTADASPAIDLRSTTVAHNVTAEEIDRLPKGRSFQSLALVAPSVNSGEIEGGFQVNGASGAENSFTVDGIVTNSLVNGSSRQNTVFEYLQEVQVKTTGIGAEYGGALGGVISAVTKSGGNQVRGEAHWYFQGSALAADPVKRLVISPSDDVTVSYIQDEKFDEAQNEIGGSIGGPIVKDHLFYFASYSPRFNRRTNLYRFSSGTDPGDVERKQDLTQLFGKVTYGSSRVTASGSFLYTPNDTTGTLNVYDDIGPNWRTTSKAAYQPNVDRGYKQDQTSGTGNVDITLTDSSFISARGGLFRDNYQDTGIPNTTSYRYLTSAIGLPFSIPANLVGPINTGGVNTPSVQITDHDTTKRGYFNLDYNHTFNAAGTHTFKGGWGYQKTTNDVEAAYPGGYVEVYWNSDFVFNGVNRGRGTYGYYAVNDRRITGTVGGTIQSLYAQDQWTIGNRLTLNLGLRSEQEKVPTFREDYLKYAFEFNFADKLAPRLGATYDVRGDGRFKVFGSWGRYYDWTKYEIVRGSFGAETWCINYRALNTTDLGSLNLSNMPGADLWTVPGSCRDRRVPSFAGSIDPDIKPMSQDSSSLGSEYQLGGTMVFGAYYTHNNLGRTIEDIGALDADGNEAYFIGNPGEGLSTLRAPNAATATGPMPKPKRQYDAVTFSLNRRYASNYFWNASYTWSRLYGNYAGLASSDEIRTPTTNSSSAVAQQQAGSISREGGNVNRSWDLDELLWDSHGNLDVQGRLATDRPHVVKLYGGYTFPFGTTAAANFYGGSGTPLSTFVWTQNQIEVFVNGRGDLGRTDVYTQTDLLLSHELRMGAENRLRFEMNVLNLFNQKTSRHIFTDVNRGANGARSSSAINLGNVNLANGYDYNALIAATPDGRVNNAKDPRNGMDDLFNPGLQAYFTVKFLF